MQAVNEKTGEVFELQGGQWVPVQKAPAEPAARKPDQFARISSGTMESMAASAGDMLTTWGRNARGLLADVRGDTATQDRIADERMEAESIRARMHEEAPIAAGVGAMLPGLATLPIGMGLGGAGMLAGGAGRLATNIGSGALTGALSSHEGDLAGGALEGGALSGASSMAANMVSRVRAGREGLKQARAQQAAGQAIGGGLDDAQREIIEGARRAGLQVTPGQALGDATMRKLEASATSNPVLSPYWDELRRANSQQVNTLAARAMGVEADNVGAAVRAQAEGQLARDFNDIGRRIGKVETSGLHKDLQALAEAEATGGLPTSDAWRILKRFEKGIEGRRGAVAGELADEIPGEALMNMRSQVAKEMRDAFAANNATKGDVMGEALELIDKHIGKAAKARGDEAAVELYGNARDRWSVLRAMDRGGATIDGQVLSGQAARLMKASDKGRMWGLADDAGQTRQMGGTGRLGENPLGDFYDALRFASSQIGKDIVGDSGTATRLATSGMFEGGLGATAGRAASYAARRAVAGPLAQRYMSMSPEAAQAWQAAAQRSALQGWAAGQQAGATAARAGQGLLAPGPQE